MNLLVSASPHIHKKVSIERIMYVVSLALLPEFIFSVYIFGYRALLLTIISIITAICIEFIIQRLTKRKITALDGSALLTGLLLSFNLPPNSPYWLPIVGSVFAIGVAKQSFGGLGYNFINPALAGRAFLMASWPTIMTKAWKAPIRPLGSTLSGISAITDATPLSIIKMYSKDAKIMHLMNSSDVTKKLFFGTIGGCIGETSALLLLIGGIFLICIKYIDWRIPFSYISTVFVLSELFYLTGITKVDGLFHILSGGLFLGAFFMATDYVTSPITHKGRVIFGISCGLLTILIRIWGGYPEGVCYSILFMNCFVPLINRSIKPKRFGMKKI